MGTLRCARLEQSEWISVLDHSEVQQEETRFMLHDKHSIETSRCQQVCSVLESLEREYRREEDWCSTEKANTSDKVAYMAQLLTKHQEQKEAFLKVGWRSVWTT